MIVATPQDAAAMFERAFAEAAAEGEILAIAYLDADRRVIALAMSAPEAAVRVDLQVRRIVEEALRLGASGLIVAHNHPSGDARPSWEDVDATRELAETASRLGIRLHDHLIYAGGETCSLRTLGLI